MTEREYRQHHAISRSELWRMHESPEKFKWFKDHPPEPTPALTFGQVVHKLLLQPETFDEDFAVLTEMDRRTKVGKEAFDAFLSRLEGRTAVIQADYDKAQEMASAVRRSRLATSLLVGEHEIEFFWTDPDTHEDCKCRCDCLTKTDDGHYIIVDYKTAGSAKTDVFNQSIFKYGYHFQAAMYSEGVMRAMDLDYRPEFVFIVQEKAAPYAVNVVSIPETVMLAGIDTFREYIGLYHQCKGTDYWFGYNGAFDEPNEAYLPGWMQLGVDEEE